MTPNRRLCAAVVLALALTGSWAGAQSSSTTAHSGAVPGAPIDLIADSKGSFTAQGLEPGKRYHLEEVRDGAQPPPCWVQPCSATAACACPQCQKGEACACPNCKGCDSCNCAKSKSCAVHTPPKQYGHLVLENVTINAMGVSARVKRIRIMYKGDGIDSNLAKCALTAGDDSGKLAELLMTAVPPCSTPESGSGALAGVACHSPAVGAAIGAAAGALAGSAVSPAPAPPAASPYDVPAEDHHSAMPRLPQTASGLPCTATATTAPVPAKPAPVESEDEDD
jgi:hypothetical protein